MREAAKDGREVGELRLDEAFTWRAGDVLKEGDAPGCCDGHFIGKFQFIRLRKGFFRTFKSDALQTYPTSFAFSLWDRKENERRLLLHA